MTPRLFTSLFTVSALLLATAGAADRVFHRGICIEGGLPLQECHIEELSRLGATHVSFNPFGFMEAPDKPRVRMSTIKSEDSRWWGESDEGLRHYARLAQEAEMKVMLRPHIWLGSAVDSEGNTGWLQNVGFSSEEEWQEFFTSYRKLALHYARLAEATDIEWYSVGAEFTRVSLEHPQFWRDLIAEIRAIYSGKLTYSANWWMEAEGIEFWDDLDAIGIQAYMPLAQTENPSPKALREGWQKYLEACDRLSRRTGRPIVFTEIGYRSTTDAAMEPWDWSGNGELCLETQTACYRAAFEALKDREWFGGMYWWKYHADPCSSTKPVSPRRLTSFSFQNKPAGEILAEEYSESAK